MAKNKDSKSVNRTGVFNYEDMTITFKDKDNIFIYDLKSLLKDFHGGNLSITMSSDFEPSYVVED